MTASPSPLNYFVGFGTLSWTPTGGSPRDLGNAPAFKVTPNFQTLDHFSSRQGSKVKDRQITVSKSGTVDVTLDEITTDNLAMLLFGTVATDTAGEEYFEIFELAQVTGALTLTGTNDEGNKFTVVVNNVNFTPGDGMDFIADTWGQIKLKGEMLIDTNGIFGTVTRTEEVTS